MLSSQPVMPTAQSFLPRYASPPAGSDEAEWRAASDGLAATLLRYATALAAVSAVVAVGTAARRVAGLETVMFSFATADEGFHAPNESWRESAIAEGFAAWVALLREPGLLRIAGHTG